MKKEDIPLLELLVKTLEEAELKLETFYNKKNYENFDKTKKFIFQLQQKISEIVK